MRLGFVVNPIAGMGGKVGLKGTDRISEKAMLRGAEPIAPRRAVEFLHRLKGSMIGKTYTVLTCPGIMGEIEAKTANIPVQALPMILKQKTDSEDTREAVRLLRMENVDLIVFVGGDGTAKDILDAFQGSQDVQVLGVPSGVKMYSGVFAVSPSDAAEVILGFAEGQTDVIDAEIIDTDEESIRKDVFTIKLHGYLKTPSLPTHIQGSKQVSPETTDEKDNQIAIARFIIEEMQPNATYILGPGTTVKCITELLKVEKTTLGVDVYREGKMLLDVNEESILRAVGDWHNTWIAVSPIGRQGILLGRGNQQISPQILRLVGKERIIVAATRGKLQSIEGNVLRVDTGDSETDDMLRGYIRVVTDYREWRLVQVL